MAAAAGQGGAVKCACGCGGEVRQGRRGKRRFLTGHWWKTRSRSERTAIGRKGVETKRAKGYAMSGAVGRMVA